MKHAKTNEIQCSIGQQGRLIIYIYISTYGNISAFILYMYVCLSCCIIKVTIFSRSFSKVSTRLPLTAPGSGIAITGVLSGKCSSNCLFVFDNMLLNNNFPGPLPQLLQGERSRSEGVWGKGFFFLRK